MRNSKVITLLLIFLLTASFVTSETNFQDELLGMYHKTELLKRVLVQTQFDLVLAHSALAVLYEKQNIIFAETEKLNQDIIQTQLASAIIHENQKVIKTGVEQVNKNLLDFGNFVINYYDRKPNFPLLQKADVRLKIGTSGGSGTVVSIEDDYIYVLTAKHCTPLGEPKKGWSFFKYNKNTKLEVEVPMLDKKFDSGKKENYLLGHQYVTIKNEDIYM